MFFAWWTEEQNGEKAVDIGENKQLPQFTLVHHEKEDCTQNYTAGIYNAFCKPI